jgi:hypothetical protein
VFDKTRLRVVLGVYRIESREIWTPGGGRPDRIGLALPPEDEGQFAEFSDAGYPLRPNSDVTHGSRLVIRINRSNQGPSAGEPTQAQEAHPTDL